MPSLVLATIVKNGAAHLPACLESVRGAADSVLIGDTGSTDGTPAVAGAHGARVMAVAWTDDFAAARNAVLDAAEGDWVLQLDADEVLDPAGAAAVRAIVDADGAGADAIEVVQANYAQGVRAWRWTPCDPASPYARGFGGYIAAPIVRLFRNGRGYRYREAVHESVTASVVALGGVIRPEPILIHHYGYAEAEAGDPRRLELYLRIARAKTLERPEDAKAWFDLAEQALAAGRAAEAEEAARTAVALAPESLDAVMALGKLLLNRGALAEAHGLLAPFAARSDAPCQLLNALGVVDTRRGRWAEARRCLERSIALEPRHPLTHAALARLCDLEERPEEAGVHLDSAVSLSQGAEEFVRLRASHARRTEGEALFRGGSAADALAAFVDALRLDPDDPLAHMNLGVAAAALGDRDQARRCLERAARLAPRHEGIEENLRLLGAT